MLSTYLLLIYHENYLRKDILIFLLIAILGFFIELIGVNTEVIFGQYFYGNALGLKLFNTPLLIALNWLFLTYTAFAVSTKISKSGMLQLLIAPSLMMLYDIILEQLAPKWICGAGSILLYHCKTTLRGGLLVSCLLV